MGRKSDVIQRILLFSLIIKCSGHLWAQSYSGAYIFGGYQINNVSYKTILGDELKDFTSKNVGVYGFAWQVMQAKWLVSTYEIEVFNFEFTGLEKGIEQSTVYNPKQSSVYDSTYRNFRVDGWNSAFGGVLHFRPYKQFFVSGGLAVDIVLAIGKYSFTDITEEIKEWPFGIHIPLGLGYSNEYFRVDLRYNLNLISMSRRGNNFTFHRYKSLYMNPMSIRFGIALGPK